MTATIRISTLLLLMTVLSACALIDFNEVLRGVSKEDPNWVRDAARKNVITERGVAEINATNVCGERSVHLAIQKGNEEILLVLIQEGADVNLPTEIAREASMCESLARSTSVTYAPAGYPPLHYAILVNNPRFAELLLFAGADPNAEASGKQSVVDLIGSKPGYDAVMNYAAAPLHLSARIGNLGRVRELVDSGTNPNGRLEPYGTTPLEEGLLGRHWPVVDYFLQNGGDQQTSVANEAVKLAIEDYIAEHESSALTNRLENLSAVSR